MQTVNLRSVMIAVTAISLSGTAANAGEIYKWVAPDGVTHYSETPPEAALASMEVIDIDSPVSTGETPRGYQSALDVANSIEASRLERERLRLEKRREQMQQRSQAVEPALEYPVPAAPIYYPRYRHFYGRPRMQHPPRMHYRPEPRSPGPYNRPNSLAHIRP